MPTTRPPASTLYSIERRVMSWASDPTPLAYDCSPSHAPHLKAMSAWSRTCRIAAARHKPRQAARLLSWRDSGAGRPNVWQLVQQLGNRTVWILGDSHVLDLWCALACVVLRASHSSDFQQRGSQWQLVTRLRPDDHGQPPGPDREVRWRVPTCAYAKGGVCGGGTHCGTLGRTSCRLGCGLSLLPSPDADEGVVVLYSPCPAYAGSPLMQTVLQALQARERAELHRFRALPSPPLRALCEAHVRNCSGRAFELSAAADHYWSTVTTAARALHRLHEQSDGRSVGVLLLAPTAHFPALEGFGDPWSLTRLDGVGSYERHLASALNWLHAHLHRANGTAVEELASWLGIASANPTSYRGESSQFESSLALGISRLEQLAADDAAKRSRGVADAASAACARQSASDAVDGARSATPLTDAAACALSILRRVGRVGRGASGPRNVLRAVRATSCEPLDGVLPTLGWRQQMELRAARAANVPVLDVFVARRSRWDLHAGLQGGPNASVLKLSNRFDCAHSSLAPGAFDAELLGLQHALAQAAAGTRQQVHATTQRPLRRRA